MIVTLVRPSFYQDSVVLLALARELRSLPGVTEAAALMATPANRDLLAQSGLGTDEVLSAGPNDLVVAIRAERDDAERARTRAEELLAARRQPRSQGAVHSPRTIEVARRRAPDANVALISVPGSWAAAEARRALELGLHVMLFSDNVAIEDEVRLKRLASSRGLLMMGPDCGTAYLSGVPLGFANVVPRGRVGMVAASGTGLQQVAALLTARGEGLSHAIGVGGRDMGDAVAGLMTLAALDALATDRGTEVVAVIGKPPAPRVRAMIEDRLRALDKPSVMALLGHGVSTGQRDGVTTVSTLEDASLAVIAALGGERWAPRPFSIDPADVRRRVEAARRGDGSQAVAMRGLYSGGTLAHEALSILEPLLGPVASNLVAGAPSRHRVVDLGADEYTAGHAHPMIDPSARLSAIRGAGENPDVGVLLLDVVLGRGAAADPAGDLAPALERARAAALARGSELAIVASVIGTAGDPQGMAAQVSRLEGAGAWLLPSNAQAARAAACLAGGQAVLNRLLATVPA